MTGFTDPYIDQAIGDLRNLLGASLPEELRDLEPQAVFANELELPEAGIPQICDLAELCVKCRYRHIAPTTIKSNT